MCKLVRGVPGFGLILAGLLASGCVAQTTDIPPDKCPAQGTATGRAAKVLNGLKNRAIAPTGAQINQQVTLDSMLADGPDRNRFDQTQGAEIVGYVIKVEQGGHPETANCGNMGTLYTDTHITVATGPGATDIQTLVVEVTPTWRVAMQKRGVDWRTETLQTTLLGHRVKFRGWLLFDTSHVREAINTAPHGTKDWRKTVWEIHPITAMSIVR